MPKIIEDDWKYQLYNEDCFETFKRIPNSSIDLVLVDPPYGTTACKWDAVIPLDRMWTELSRIKKNGVPLIIFGSEPFSSAVRVSNLKEYKYDWIWDKKKPSNFPLAKKQPMKYHENIMIFSSKVYYPIMVPVIGRKAKKGVNKGAKVFNKGLEKEEYLDKIYTDKYPSSILEISNADQTNRVHPTQKPIPLMEYLIKTYSNEGDTVLDFAFGSGTTGVACGNLNRKFIGCDSDKEHGYFQIAQQRIKAAYQK